jgi:hypothetical protein
MVGEMRGQVNERRGVGSLSIGYFLQNRHYTQNARNRDSECNGISTVVRLRLRARELHQLVGLRSGKRLRCEVFEGNSKQAILWCVLRTGLLGENQQSEGFRNHFRPGMRILGRGGRWRSEVFPKVSKTPATSELSRCIHSLFVVVIRSRLHSKRPKQGF